MVEGCRNKAHQGSLRRFGISAVARLSPTRTAGPLGNPHGQPLSPCHVK